MKLIYDGIEYTVYYTTDSKIEIKDIFNNVIATYDIINKTLNILIENDGPTDNNGEIRHTFKNASEALIKAFIRYEHLSEE